MTSFARRKVTLSQKVKRVGTLTVRVREARGLVPKSTSVQEKHFGTNDPYFEVKLKNKNNRQRSKKKLPPVYNSLNPKWGEECLLTFRNAHQSDVLLLILRDHSKGSAHVYGEIRMPVTTLAGGDTITRWFPLQKRKGQTEAATGEVHVGLSFQLDSDTGSLSSSMLVLPDSDEVTAISNPSNSSISLSGSSSNFDDLAHSPSPSSLLSSSPSKSHVTITPVSSNASIPTYSSSINASTSPTISFLHDSFGNSIAAAPTTVTSPSTPHLASVETTAPELSQPLMSLLSSSAETARRVTILEATSAASSPSRKLSSSNLEAKPAPAAPTIVRDDSGKIQKPNAAALLNAFASPRLRRGSTLDEKWRAKIEKAVQRRNSVLSMERRKDADSRDLKRVVKGKAAIQTNATRFAKQQLFNILFQLPEEDLLADYAAMLVRQTMQHGTLFVSRNYLCFYANMYEAELKFVVGFASVLEFSVLGTVGILVRADKEFVFHFPAFRDEILSELREAWQECRSRPSGPYEISPSSSPSPETPHATNHNNNAGELPIASYDVLSTDGEESASESATEAGGATKEEEDEDSDESQTTESPSQQMFSDAGAVDKSFLKNTVRLQPLIDGEVFDVSIADFFLLLWSDSSTAFVQLYHADRHDRELVIGPWLKHGEYGFIRCTKFLTPVRSALGPKEALLNETQRYNLIKGGRLIIEKVSQLQDIPYGTYFQVEERWEARALGEQQCELSVRGTTHFVKKCMFKKTIENQSLSGVKDAVSAWVRVARGFLTTAKHMRNDEWPTSAATGSKRGVPVIRPSQEGNATNEDPSSPVSTSALASGQPSSPKGNTTAASSTPRSSSQSAQSTGGTVTGTTTATTSQQPGNYSALIVVLIVVAALLAFLLLKLSSINSALLHLQTTIGDVALDVAASRGR